MGHLYATRYGDPLTYGGGTRLQDAVDYLKLRTYCMCHYVWDDCVNSESSGLKEVLLLLWAEATPFVRARLSRTLVLVRQLCSRRLVR